MRIRHIRIDNWRHFENVSIVLDPSTSLVCIVGANGTGKSHLLELIAACAHRLGLSRGIEIPRGDPFADQHKFSLQFHLALGVSQAIDELTKEPQFKEWDRTLTIESQRIQERSVVTITAGGITDANLRANLGSSIVKRLERSEEVNFLSLDANRAYPRKNVDSREIAQAYEIDWEDVEHTRGRSFKPSATLYDEWIKYFLAQENQSGTRLIQATRKARKRGETPPEFDDHFDGYASALQNVLPHVVFTGVDPKKRTLLFDTTGLELSFDQLSGGEREIAFLIGQIDRFGLRNGLFLIDEPELHLNADLVRSWVAYLTSSVAVGQVWIATHSMEAAEAAGQKATFVLERNEMTRKVDSAVSLASKPVLSILSRAVGSPAFSISQLRFVFVEGEEALGERERFRRLTNASPRVRFMEAGACTEVIRRVKAIKALSDEAGSGIRIGGIIDMDFRCAADSAALASGSGVLVLAAHEIENLLLDPQTIRALSTQNGKSALDPSELIRQLADERSGSWIFQYAMATRNAAALPEISVAAKGRAKTADWAKFSQDWQTVLASIASVSGFNDPDRETFMNILSVSFQAYQRIRDTSDLWKLCEGKQVLQCVARACGYADASTYESAALVAWEKGIVPVPVELQSLRDYVAGL